MIEGGPFQCFMAHLNWEAGSTQDFNARRMRIRITATATVDVSMPAVTDTCMSLPQTITCRNSNLKVNT